MVEHKGGGGSRGTEGTTPCTWICTKHSDASLEHDEGALASRRQ
jgi:hypothetical protein